MKTIQSSQPWFMSEPDTLFLAVIFGEGVHETKIIRAAELVDAYLETFHGLPAEKEEREKWTALLADPDQWTCDQDETPCLCHQECETGHLDFIRLENLSIVGALPTAPDVDDGAPDCPMMHVLHPNAAGQNPRLLYGVPVKRQNNELTESLPRPKLTIGEDANRGSDSVL